MSNRFAHLPSSPEDAEIWRFRIPREEIGYFNCVLEVYDGLGLVQTIDKKAGLVEVQLAPAFKNEFLIVLEDLMKNAPGIRLLSKEIPYSGE